jgi:hypothetical protein
VRNNSARVRLITLIAKIYEDECFHDRFRHLGDLPFAKFL